jgi:hypothetical protein
VADADEASASRAPELASEPVAVSSWIELWDIFGEGARRTMYTQDRGSIVPGKGCDDYRSIVRIRSSGKSHVEQPLLGHTSVRMTMVYAKISNCTGADP